ncbi:MAG: diaminopimelate decarboxylase [Clostridiales bacterium]|nr:diaminopimelate decarboxylase [Clostridiales bacterium]
MQNLNNSIYNRGNEYFIQEQNMKSLCETYETPFYMYDANYMLKKYDSLKKYLCWNNTKIFYAMKANYNPHLLKIMRDHGFYLDTVSPSEVMLALKLGFERDHIMFTANNMTDEEMNQVKEQGVMFNIDSLVRLEKYAKEYAGSAICIRVNPNVIAGENEKVQTGGDQCKFGILLSDIPKVLKIAKQHNLRIVGVHEHTGSGISDLTKVFKSMNNVLDILNPIDFPDLKFVDFGGGFKVQYDPNEKPIDYAEFGAKAGQLFQNFCMGYGRELEMYFEPGKYIVADGGCFVVQVNTIKNNNGRLIVGTNSGFPHLIRPVFYGAYHHIINVSNPEGTPHKYDIYGNTCESGDCFACERELPEIRIGDYLVIQNAGAYCRSMASEYNLRAFPSEYIVYNNEVITSKKRISNAELAERILSDYGIED